MTPSTQTRTAQKVRAVAYTSERKPSQPAVDNRGWCPNCGAARLPDVKPAKNGEKVCRDCGDELFPLDLLSEADQAAVKLQDWFANICRRGLNGPSQSEAAKELGCHRTMIDRLVSMGILERNEFNFKGQKLVIISSRSLAIAKDNRKRTGNWTGFPVRKGS